MYSGYHTKSKGRLYRKYLLTCPRVVFHEMIHCIQHIAKQIVRPSLPYDYYQVFDQ